MTPVFEFGSCHTGKGSAGHTGKQGRVLDFTRKRAMRVPTTKAEARRLHEYLRTRLRGLKSDLAPVGTFLRPVGIPYLTYMYEVSEHYVDEREDCAGMILTVWTCFSGEWKPAPGPTKHWREDIRLIRGDTYRCLSYHPETEISIAEEPPYYREVQLPGQQRKLF
jgi:hypothetical protein